MENTQNTETTTTKKYYSVGGWLLFFCIVLTIISPLFTIWQLWSSYSWGSPYFSTFPGVARTYYIDLVLSIILMIYSIRAGVALWTMQPGAVRVAKNYLFIYLGYVAFSSILVFTSGLPAEANQAMAGEVVKVVVRGIIFFTVWYLYLTKSERVRETYGTDDAATDPYTVSSLDSYSNRDY